MTDPQAAIGARVPLMIVGCPRSGTTFLAHMINRFLDLHIARDAGVFLRFHRALPYYGDLTDPASMRRLVDDLYKDAMFRTRFLQRGLELDESQLCRAIAEPSYAGLVRQVFVETARTHGKEYWGNKKPSYALHLSDLDAVFPNAKTVHIIRDGRDVVLSMRRSVRLLVEKNWYFAASDWVEHVRLARENGRALGSDRYLEIKYETLLTKPVDVFREILTFSGATDADSLLSRVEGGIHARIRPGNFEKWRTQMPERAVRIVERVGGPLLCELGYPLQYPEEVGRGFSRAQLGVFAVDRVFRNLFTRDARQFVSAHFNEFASAGRARLGGLLARRTRTSVHPKTSA